MANIYFDDLCFRSGSLQWIVQHTRSKDTTMHMPTWACTVNTLALKEEDIEFLRKIVTVLSSFSLECSVQCLWPSKSDMTASSFSSYWSCCSARWSYRRQKRLLNGPPNCEQWPSCQSITTLTRSIMTGRKEWQDRWPINQCNWENILTVTAPQVPSMPRRVSPIHKPSYPLGRTSPSSSLCQPIKLGTISVR